MVDDPAEGAVNAVVHVRADADNNETATSSGLTGDNTLNPGATKHCKSESLIACTSQCSMVADNTVQM